MKEYTIKNISNTRIEFDTKSKKNIFDVFHYTCKSFYQLEKEELTIINDKMCLPIVLSKWKDIDDDTDFLNVLHALKLITDPKSGNPAIILGAKLIGYDNDRQLSFLFTTSYINGRHCVVGTYDDLTKMLYTDTLYIEENARN